MTFNFFNSLCPTLAKDHHRRLYRYNNSLDLRVVPQRLHSLFSANPALLITAKRRLYPARRDRFTWRQRCSVRCR
jgi:hypothetical protein